MSKRDFHHQLREPGAAVYGELSRWGRFQFDPLLGLLLVLLMGVGLVVLYSADDSGHAQLRRQAVYMAAGLVVMLATAQLSPRFLERWAWWPYGLAVLLLLAVDLIGSDAKGARRWLVVVLAGIVCFSLSALALLAPIDTLVQIGPISFEIPSTLLILGRRLVLEDGHRPFLALIYTTAGFWFLGSMVARANRLFVPMGLAMVALLVAVSAVEPFLYAALLVEMEKGKKGAAKNITGNIYLHNSIGSPEKYEMPRENCGSMVQPF